MGGRHIRGVASLATQAANGPQIHPKSILNASWLAASFCGASHRCTHIVLPIPAAFGMLKEGKSLYLEFWGFFLPQDLPEWDVLLMTPKQLKACLPIIRHRVKEFFCPQDELDGSSPMENCWKEPRTNSAAPEGEHHLTSHGRM